MKKIFNTFVYYFFVVIILFLFIIGIISNTTGENKSQRNIDLETLKSEVDSSSNKIIFSKELGKDYNEEYLVFYTQHEKVRVFIDGNEIYTFNNVNIFKGKTPGSKYNFVPLDNCKTGAKLKIELEGVYDNPSDELSTIMGSRGDIYYYLIYKDIWSTVINIGIAIAGIIIFTLSLWVKRILSKEASLIYLSIFTFSFSVWSATETSIAQLLIQNSTIEYLICYISLYIFPVSLILYVKSNNLFQEKINNMLNIIINTHFILITILFILHFTGLMDFTQSLPVFHILLILEAIVIIHGFYKYMIKINNNITSTRKQFTKLGFIILFFANISDIIRYKIGINDAALFSRIVILVYLVILITNIIKDFLNIIKENEKTQLYKQLAFEDTLTKLRNRTALNEDLNTINLSNCSLISFDVNNLKYYNDKFGHEKGDLLIKIAANQIKNVFGHYSYRMGGDEFLAIIKTKDEKIIKELIHKFNENSKNYNNDNSDGIILEVAVGYSIYNDGDNIDNLMKKSDKLMYKNKKLLKSQQKNIITKHN